MTQPPEFYSLITIPPDVLKYETHSRSSRLKKALNFGMLRMKLERNVESQKTIITQQFCRVPLLIQRPLYLEESLHPMAFVYILSPSGGILQGDRYHIDVTLSKNAVAHITTQGATRIYKMEGNFGTQIINIVQEEGTYLEYIPDQIIPYANSKFYQVVNLNIHDNATMIYSELLAPGRVASGESFKYDICYIKTIARNQAGKLRFTDVVKLEPNTENLEQVGMFGTSKVLSTVYIITQPVYVQEIQDKINELIDRTQGTVFGGTSKLPRNQGLIIRLLGKGSEELRNLIFQIVAISRMLIMGASFTCIRKP